MFKDNKDFYPTPKELAYKLLDMLPDIRKINTLLEPSCGAGTLIEHFTEYYIENNRYRFSRYDKKNINQYVAIDGIEIDDRLTAISRSKGINVIYDDFMSFNNDRFYSLILANFPFSVGVDHFLKAIEIQSVVGGEILGIINAETIKNTYSNKRKMLVSLLEKYGAKIEFVQDGFTEGERTTSVEVALIYVNIPMTDNMTMFERQFKRDNPDIGDGGFNTLIPNMNKLQKLVFECELVKKSITELYKESLKINSLLSSFGVNNPIQICNNNCNADPLTLNEFINKTNLSYWEKFITETDFKKRLPSELKDSFSSNMKKQKDIAFNIENVMYFYNELINSIPESYEKTVAKVFNTITNKHSYSDSVYNKTIYLFTGWKTNTCYKINNKSILPFSMGWSFYDVPSTLHDLNIIFENITGKKDPAFDGRNSDLVQKIKAFEKNIETEHFILDVYKKGTIHIKYKDKLALDQFNILANKGRNALPPDFGTKSYADMDSEEKRIVKEFGLEPMDYNLISCNGNNYIRLNAGDM